MVLDDKKVPDEKMVFGYIRVSSNDQNPERQYAAFAEYERENNIKINRNYEDKASGKTFNRTDYNNLKANLRRGDTIIIKELDRLGRDMEQIKKEWQEIQSKGVDIIVIDTPILNTKNKNDLEKSLISNIVFELLAYLAEKERIKIRSRQREGIELAKTHGKYTGRKPIEIEEKRLKEVCKKWRAGEITAREAMKQVNLEANTFYRRVKKLGL
jgi:DNA invertase Pin-like site-specific DNA recombinase